MKNCGNRVIVSMATYDKRFDYFKKTFRSLVNQTLAYANLFINIPDNSPKDYVNGLEQFLSKFPIEVQSKTRIFKRDYRWRSANKLIWTAKENPDSAIITCDDDIFYQNYFFERLYSKWIENRDCIIAHEVSPVFLDNNDRIMHISAYDVKLLQKAFGRYLTGCCLFPPGILLDTNYLNFDLYNEITGCTHDEIWFWTMTTLKGVRSIGLNCTWSFDADGLVLPRDKYSLSTINSDPYLSKYNEKVNRFFGENLKKVLLENPCIFPVSNENLMAIVGNMEKVNQIYRKYPILFECNEKTVERSALNELVNAVLKFKWENKVKIRHERYGK